MSDDGICRLCERDSKLRESHIIPRSLIRLVRDKKLGNRFYELHNKRCQTIQDGPKEFLLCDNCEQRIGSFEKYFIEAVHYGRRGTKKKQSDQVLLIESGRWIIPMTDFSNVPFLREYFAEDFDA